MQFGIAEVQKNVMDILKTVIEICDSYGIMYYAQAGTVLGAVRHGGPIPWDYDADIIVPNDQIDKFTECMTNHLPKKYYVDYFKANSLSKRQFPRIGLKGYTTEVLHLDVFRLIGLPDDRDQQVALLTEARAFERIAVTMRRQPMWKTLLKGQFEYALGQAGMIQKNTLYYVKKFDELCERYPYGTAAYISNPSGKYGAKNIFLKDVYGDGQIVNFLDYKIRIPSNVDFYLKQYYGDYMKTPPQEYIDQEMNKIFYIK